MKNIFLALILLIVMVAQFSFASSAITSRDQFTFFKNLHKIVNDNEINDIDLESLYNNPNSEELMSASLIRSWIFSKWSAKDDFFWNIIDTVNKRDCDSKISPKDLNLFIRNLLKSGGISPNKSRFNKNITYSIVAPTHNILRLITLLDKLVQNEKMAEIIVLQGDKIKRIGLYKHDDKYYYYDPTCKSGEVIFHTSGELLQTILSKKKEMDDNIGVIGITIYTLCINQNSNSTAEDSYPNHDYLLAKLLSRDAFVVGFAEGSYGLNVAIQIGCLQSMYFYLQYLLTLQLVNGYDMSEIFCGALQLAKVCDQDEILTVIKKMESKSHFCE